MSTNFCGDDVDAGKREFAKLRRQRVGLYNQAKKYQNMPRKFDTTRIYELPVLRHNTAAINLIYQSVMGHELSQEFLKKAIDHNTRLAKLSRTSTPFAHS